MQIQLFRMRLLLLRELVLRRVNFRYFVWKLVFGGSGYWAEVERVNAGLF